MPESLHTESLQTESLHTESVQPGSVQPESQKSERHEIRGYDAVRAAARDYENYSSDLQGDRDVRDYRQLPLEADPPRHTKFRAAVQPLFLSAAIEPKVGQFEELAHKLIEKITAQGGGDIPTDLALPYVIGCLTIIYNRPQDYDEWLSWGPDVWMAEAYAAGTLTPTDQSAQRERNFEQSTQRSGATLERYLTRVFNHAQDNPNTDPDTMDVWDSVSQLVVDDIPLTRKEMHGIANVLLAGGRDTVIKLITGITWHLTTNATDREHLTEHPESHNSAIAEFARYLSPLPKMERIPASARPADGSPADPEDYVLLSFVSANHDRGVWPDANVLDIHRDRKPHVAFGFGRHSCMGMNITEHESRAFLRVLLSNWPNWELDGEARINWITEGEGDTQFTAINHFESVPVRVAGTA